ncbi:MAG TPA: glutathione S-transferase family protein [Burkholderiales bacterium]|nr:glutathione S-transferase family protein [Burkholderiales bacterium]
MLKLYEHPLSAYAMKVKIALNEKKIEYETAIPDGMSNGTATGEFVDANPRAEVPTLLDGDLGIFDSTVILEYLEEKWPSPALLPETPAERARVRMIEDVMDTRYEANNWGTFEVLRYKRASGTLAEQLIAYGRKNIEGLQAWLNRRLGDRPWFNGDAFGWGDLSVIPYLNRSAGYGYLPAKGSKLLDWFERANQRESVARVRSQMQAALDKMPDLADLLNRGQVVRQYRDHRLEWMIASGGIEVVANGLEKGSIRFGRTPG